MSDGIIYIDYQTVWNYFNSGFYWEEGRAQLMLTLPEGTLSWTPDDGSSAVILGEDGTPYISAACIQENSDIDLTIYQDPDRVVARTDWSGIEARTVTENTPVRYPGRPLKARF